MSKKERTHVRRHVFALFVVSAAMLLAAAPGRAQSDPRNPAPWPGGGIDVANNHRAHTYYYRLSTRHPRPTQQREISLRVLSRGGTTTATLVDNAVAPTRTYMSLGVTSRSAAEQTDLRTTRFVPAVAPILVVNVPADVTHWAVMVEDRMVNRVQHAPPHGRSPADTRTPTPAPDAGFPMRGPSVPGATAWPGTLSGPVPEGYAPVYYYIDVPGGPVTFSLSASTAFSVSVTVQVLDPGSAPPPGDFPLFTPLLLSFSSGSGNPETQTAGPVTRTLERGRYVLKVTRESASRASTYSITIR